MRGKHNKLGEGERKVRFGQDSLPNIAISVAETSGNYNRLFTRTLKMSVIMLTVIMHSVMLLNVLVPMFDPDAKKRFPFRKLNRVAFGSSKVI